MLYVECLIYNVKPHERIRAVVGDTEVNSMQLEYTITAQGSMFDLLSCKFFNADSIWFSSFSLSMV
ncbi:hypothetical protein IW16_18580 [Chryseobacterium vrystaatense]|uniref:Uncharacterized protein n=1 Tax=Chryseobacterium vrystaatense TaxID=307480 RepID=A0ABR4UJK9_9FLAO|nr:hypothetical protein IW16_18580 [Chryseobacterium vrystaatense]